MAPSLLAGFLFFLSFEYCLAFTINATTLINKEVSVQSYLADAKLDIYLAGAANNGTHMFLFSGESADTTITYDYVTIIDGNDFSLSYLPLTDMDQTKYHTGYKLMYPQQTSSVTVSGEFLISSYDISPIISREAPTRFSSTSEQLWTSATSINTTLVYWNDAFRWCTCTISVTSKSTTYYMLMAGALWTTNYYAVMFYNYSVSILLPFAVMKHPSVQYF